MSTDIAQAIAEGVLPGRVWMYSNYHCNLTCDYCLTASSPNSARRELDPERMIEIATQAKELGFTQIGVTGGEPFLLPTMPDTLAALSEILPTLVLTNGTMFAPKRMAKVMQLAGKDVALQISLDSPDPEANDEFRGPENFAKVVETIPRLVQAGLTVRIATTADPGRLTASDHSRLCELHRSLGVADEDHIVRPIISRGRADEQSMGVGIPHHQIPAELTVTADGTYWSPFGPTITNGRLDTDLLISRTSRPLSVGAGALLGLVRGRPQGADAQLSIR